MEQFAADFAIMRQYTTLDAMLADGGVDALVISTPNYLHTPWIITALEAGVHGMVEEPMSKNATDFGICDEIFVHHVYYSTEKLFHDVPEFHPQISLEEGMAQVFEELEREDQFPNLDEPTWEGDIIARQKSILK